MSQQIHICRVLYYNSIISIAFLPEEKSEIHAACFFFCSLSREFLRLSGLSEDRRKKYCTFLLPYTFTFLSIVFHKSFNGVNMSDTCFSCATSLKNSQYYSKDGHSYCISCYEVRFSPTCTKCHQKITSGQKVVAMLLPSFHFFLGRLSNSFCFKILNISSFFNLIESNLIINNTDIYL